MCEEESSIWETVLTTCVPLPKVSRVHSSAIACEVRFGFHASRPYPYRFAIANGCPSQFSSSPTFTTALYPPSDRRQVLPGTISLTDVRPTADDRRLTTALPSMCISKSSVCFHIGTR